MHEKRNLHWIVISMRKWADGVLMLVPDEDGDHDGNLSPGTCWAIVHECYERPVYARLDPGETVEDLKRDIEAVRPKCHVLLPTASSGPNTKLSGPQAPL